MNRANSVDQYIRQCSQWRDELAALRDVLRTTKLKEEIKWGAPCYTHNGKNVVGVGGFKSYFGLWFHQGALFDDDIDVLINAQDGKTKALRQWRMTSASEIKPSIIKRYVNASIRHVDAGYAIKADKNRAVVVPPELQKALRLQKGAAGAYRDLRLGLRREFADYVSSAKRDETKQRRIGKVLAHISSGTGLNDKYRR